MAPGNFIGDLEIHPAACLFPEMGSKDLAKLIESVREHGIRQPLVFYEGKLVDGRNRWRAATVAGIPSDKVPRRNLPTGTDPYQWAWDLNCSRLDYLQSQKAAIRIKIEEASGEFARRRSEIAAEATKARTSGKVRSLVIGPMPSRGGRGPITKPGERSRVAKEIAEKAHVSPRTVERVLKLKKEDPEAFEGVAKGAPLPRKAKPLSTTKHVHQWVCRTCGKEK